MGWGHAIAEGLAKAGVAHLEKDKDITCILCNGHKTYKHKKCPACHGSGRQKLSKC